MAADPARNIQAVPAPGADQAPESAKQPTDPVSRIAALAGNPEEAATVALEVADNDFQEAAKLMNRAAVQVPGTKTVWTERRLREFRQGMKRPGV